MRYIQGADPLGVRYCFIFMTVSALLIFVLHIRYIYPTISTAFDETLMIEVPARNIPTISVRIVGVMFSYKIKSNSGSNIFQIP